MEIFNRKLNNIILRKSKKLNIESEKDRHIKSYARKNNKVLLVIIDPLISEETKGIDISTVIGIDWIFDEINFDKTKEISLLVNIYGGYDTLLLAKTIRRLFEKIKVFIPGVAASSGTLLSLIGDEIIMGRMGHLSPVDSQTEMLDGKDEVPISAKSFSSGFKKLLEEIKKQKNIDSPVYKALKALIEKIDLRLKDEYERTLISDIMETEDILLLGGYSKTKAHYIADKLVNGYPTHGYIIDYYEAHRLGLRVKQSKEYPEEWNLMKYWFVKYFDKSSEKLYVRYVIP